MKISKSRPCNRKCGTDIYLKDDGSGWKAYNCDDDLLHFCSGKKKDFTSNETLSDEIISLDQKETEAIQRIRYN